MCLFCPLLASADKQKNFIFTSFTEQASWVLLSLNKCRDGSRVPSSCYCMLFIELSQITFIKIKPLALNTITILISTLPNKNSVAGISHHCDILSSILTSSHQTDSALESLIKVMLLLTTEIRCLISPKAATLSNLT